MSNTQVCMFCRYRRTSSQNDEARLACTHGQPRGHPDTATGLAQAPSPLLKPAHPATRAVYRTS